MANLLTKAATWFKYLMIPWYMSLGIPRKTVTLEVVGRLSGKPRRGSLTMVAIDGGRYLVALGEQSEWVQNVRAAEGRAVVIYRGRHPVCLKEIPLEARGRSYWNMSASELSAPRGKSARLFSAWKGIRT